MKHWFCKQFLLLCFSLLVVIHSFAQKSALPALKVDELVQYYQQAKGIMVVNFWSTWCKPCIEEIPHFIEVANKFKNDSVQLTLVSQDTKTLYESGKLMEWLKKKNWKNANVVWLNETNADYYCPKVDASWSGVIPATLIINPSRNYYQFFEDSLSAEALEEAIKKAIRS